MFLRASVVLCYIVCVYVCMCVCVVLCVVCCVCVCVYICVCVVCSGPNRTSSLTFFIGWRLLRRHWCGRHKPWKVSSGSSQAEKRVTRDKMTKRHDEETK